MYSLRPDAQSSGQGLEQAMGSPGALQRHGAAGEVRASVHLVPNIEFCSHQPLVALLARVHQESQGAGGQQRAFHGIVGPAVMQQFLDVVHLDAVIGRFRRAPKKEQGRIDAAVRMAGRSQNPGCLPHDPLLHGRYHD